MRLGLSHFTNGGVLILNEEIYQSQSGHVNEEIGMALTCTLNITNTERVLPFLQFFGATATIEVGAFFQLTFVDEGPSRNSTAAYWLPFTDQQKGLKVAGFQGGQEIIRPWEPPLDDKGNPITPGDPEGKTCGAPDHIVHIHGINSPDDDFWGDRDDSFDDDSAASSDIEDTWNLIKNKLKKAHPRKKAFSNDGIK
jgi:hypothetical protein